jgi:polyadenylate-binding protein
LDLYKYFSSRGYKIQKSKVVLDKNTSKPRGYGYLTFYTQEEADRCISEMNNQVLDGQAIRLSHQIQRGQEKYDEKANILIKNIDKEVTQQELFSAFAKFGNIISCKLESYPDGTSRGFAYVQYEKVEDADKAIDQMNGTELKGQKLAVNRHEKRSDRGGQQPKFNNLFVGNLPAGTDEAKLQALFQEFGEVESVFVQKDGEGNLRDSGFVCFKDPEAAERAAENMNKKQIGPDQFLIVNRHISKKDNELLQSGSKIHPIS